MAKKKKKEKRRKPSSAGISISLMDAYSKLRKVLKAIPECDFDCIHCEKNCCVSPYISPLEFLYVAQHIKRHEDNPTALMLRKSKLNADNVKICPFLDENSRCLIYDVRHYKCRMTGMDIVDHLFTDVCEHKKKVGIKSPDISKEQWARWIDILTKINKPLLYVEQLQFDQWIDFYFSDDHRLTKNEIKLRDFMRSILCIEEIIPTATSEDLLD